MEKNNDLLRPNGDGTFSLTEAGHNLLHGALMRSTKKLYTIKRKKD